jgi:hypothetical protein
MRIDDAADAGSVTVSLVVSPPPQSGRLPAGHGDAKVTAMRKKLRLGITTLRVLDNNSLSILGGGWITGPTVEDTNDGTNSGFPVCRTYFYCPQPWPTSVPDCTRA